MYRDIIFKLNKVFCKIRELHYKSTFNSFGKKSRILGRIKVYSPENLSIGIDTSINEGVILNARAELKIGNHVHISPGVIINTGSLDYEKKGIERMHTSSKVIICDGVWLGSGCIINPAVTVGENSVIGAGAVVTRDIPPNCIAVGIPARVMREI